ncbi:sensor histidine kinase [Desulfopila inferna]|uniref:sensor histidine kinase n=1 Tax=Desulfopila inferna TaxID=468528 RepID=UPI00196410A2|nr:ATP-binding protein [Desulfopila inferna]MBM9603959.1 ATP-binding protein [Desulfopila inferna]
MIWNFFLYLLYGLAFFTLGIAILSRDIRLSELGIARIIWLLATFGIIHGFHEWLDLLSQLYPHISPASFSLLRLVVVSFSFLFLLYFGIFLNIITLYGDQALKRTPPLIKGLVGVSALTLILVALVFDVGSGKDIHVRIFVAFPGALLAGIGLIFYSRTVRLFSANVAVNFILAGSFMVCYAFLTGVVPSDVVVPGIGVKIVMFRGICAFFIMIFTIRALSVFSLEQRELVNEQLQRFSQSEKLASMGILAAGISHEINNPLANISLNLEMLKDLLKADEKIDRKVSAIERNVNRASRIARELLHFSREKETALEPTDINEVIKSSIDLLKTQKLSTIIYPNLQKVPEILGIPWKLEEVIINLLMNSIDSCTEKGRIDVETLFENGYVKIVITDTGQGIAEENLTKIFDPFFTTKEIGKGTGLGLSVCYNIVQQHGGNISLASGELGGAVASLSFPVKPDEQ